MKLKILVATTNKGKLAELSAMLDADVQWLSLADFPNTPEVIEDGETFAENAAKKAFGYAQTTGCITIADDSGLEIDALNGEPGINSARFSGEKTPDEDGAMIDHRNIDKVLQLMQGMPTSKRTARFVCNLCIASGEGILAEAAGTLEGSITELKMGHNGFGYDPIFHVTEAGKTAAQMSPHDKNTLSHRAKATFNLKPLLTNILNKTT
jgi:XTP/dITP diphosphohydrolase